MSTFSDVFREGDVTIPLKHFQTLQDCLRSVYKDENAGRSLAGDSDHEVTFVAIMTHRLLTEVYGLKCQIWSLQDSGASGFSNRRRRVSVIVTEGGNIIDVHGLCPTDSVFSPWCIKPEGLSMWNNNVFTRRGIFSVYRKFGHWTPRMEVPVTCDVCNGTGQIAGLGDCDFCKQSRGNTVTVELPTVIKSNSRIDEFSPSDFNKVGIMKDDLCALWTIHALKEAHARPKEAEPFSYGRNPVRYGIDGGVFVFEGMKTPCFSFAKKEHTEIYQRIHDMYVEKTK